VVRAERDESRGTHAPEGPAVVSRGLGPLFPTSNATPSWGWAGGAATRPDDPGVRDVGPKVVGQGGKYYKIEILPNLIIRVPKGNVKAVNGRVMLFKNPISQLNCIAHFE
jgi:hypothetical protein